MIYCCCCSVTMVKWAHHTSHIDHVRPSQKAVCFQQIPIYVFLLESMADRKPYLDQKIMLPMTPHPLHTHIRSISHMFNVLQHLYCGLGLITYTILYCDTTTLCLCWEQISGWGCILIITSHSSRFWSLYMYEEDLLWLWLLWVSSGWGVSSINHM
jgi:hypothetical protein